LIEHQQLYRTFQLRDRLHTRREGESAEVLDAQRLVTKHGVNLRAKLVHATRVLQKVIESKGKEAYQMNVCFSPSVQASWKKHCTCCRLMAYQEG
jgi:hypothetical protein